MDSDELVVKSEGRSIPEIFASCGEEGFRDIEQRVLADLVGVAGMVLSTGGGSILREGNRDALKKIGIVVWLDSSPDILFDRAIRSGKRPLLQTSTPRETFDRLLAERTSIYESLADFRFDSSLVEQDEAARRVLEQAMRIQAQRC